MTFLYIILLILLFAFVLAPHIKHSLNDEKYEEIKKTWLKEKNLKTLDESFIPSPFNPFNRFISNRQAVFLVTVVDRNRNQGEVYFCFGSPLTGGFSHKFEVKWKTKIKEKP